MTAQPVRAALSRKTLNAVYQRLLPWFEQAQRDLPWRKQRSPYRVWVSEVMLQQTRVDAAIDYYRRFMKRYPSVRKLAEASRRDVLKSWEGLGYYSRARSLHDAAKEVVLNHKGRFPKTMKGMLALPGIGPYTAAAVGSLAMGLRVGVLDGNVIRVLSRWMALSDDVGRPKTRRFLQMEVDRLVQQNDPGRVNESLMELGALICLPKNPKCTACPMQTVCAAFKAGKQELYPVMPRRKKVPHRHVGAAIIVNRRGEILLAQRKESSMLGGLWEFPGGGVEAGETVPQCIQREIHEELGMHIEVGAHFLTVAHAFSHFTMDLHSHWCRITSGRPRRIECADYVWVKPSKIFDYPLPKADQQIRDLLIKNDRPGFVEASD